MKFLKEDLPQQFPPLYSQEHVEDPLVVCKFFMPETNWTWYALEFDGDDLFFGWVYDKTPGRRYFSLRQFQDLNRLGICIELDLHFMPTLLSEVKKLHGDPSGEVCNV